MPESVVCADNVTVALDGWVAGGTVNLNRSVAVLGAAGANATLDFGRLPFVILVYSGGQLNFTNLNLQGEGQVDLLTLVCNGFLRKLPAHYHTAPLLHL